MVDAHFAGLGVSLAIVRASPGARGRVAVVADLDVVAITAKDKLAGVAVALDGLPVGEQVAVIAAVVVGLSNGQVGEQAAGSGLAGDAILDELVNPSSGAVGENLEAGLHESILTGMALTRARAETREATEYFILTDLANEPATGRDTGLLRAGDGWYDC